jgi:inner membrane protein YidH
MPEMERDPRVYFAAERTFLAWIRTGLALMGFGFVVARFGLFLRQIAISSHDPGIRTYGFSLWAGTGLVMLGVLLNAAAAVRHIQLVNGMKRGDTFIGGPSIVGVVVALVLALVGIAMVIFLIAVE